MILAKEFEGELWIKASLHNLEVKRAVDAEREACARAAEDVVPRHTECGNKIAAAIRERGRNDKR